MLIASKSDHDPMVHGVKSKIRKKNAGKSSSCPEYAQASVQIPREDQPMILGPDQTIGGIYRLFRKCSGGADGGVLGVNGSIRPSCLDKVLCALQVNGRVFIDFGAGDGRAQVASLLKGAISAYGYELPANKAHQFVLNAVLSKCPEDVITRVQCLSSLDFQGHRRACRASRRHRVLRLQLLGGDPARHAGENPELVCIIPFYTVRLCFSRLEMARS